jgi:hypothetical protein
VTEERSGGRWAWLLVVAAAAAGVAGGWWLYGIVTGT